LRGRVASLRGNFVTIRGVRTEPILLVHGLGSSFEHGWRAPGWADLIADAGRKVIPVDLLGHGTAEAPHDPGAYADLESSIERALPGERVDAIGFSLGAQLLLRVAGRTPERFGRLVVIGVGANLLSEGDTSALADAFESGAEPANITARLFVNLALSAGNDPLAISACLRRPHQRLTTNDLALVSTPTLVIIGDKDFAGPGEPLVEALPNATLVTLQGVDHFRATSEFACIDAALEFVEATI
jgi:pimeloyl-ACP methyl ester carboxylesterase